MSKIKNSGLDQYGTGRFEQQQFGTAGGEGVNHILYSKYHVLHAILPGRVQILITILGQGVTISC